MKPATVFLSRMTNRELEQFLMSHDSSAVLIPTGSTEQHGPHSALGTDVLIPEELCRRVAPDIPAVVAPPISYGLPYPHRGFKGEFSLRIDTFMNVVSDLCVTFAAAGFRRIVFVNGHYDNTYAIAFGCARVADQLPQGTQAFPVTYWEGFPPERAREFMGGDKGLHANVGEVSALLAISPDLVDMSLANAELPNFPSYKTSAAGSILRISSRPRGALPDNEERHMGRRHQGKRREREAVSRMGSGGRHQPSRGYFQLIRAPAGEVTPRGIRPTARSLLTSESPAATMLGVAHKDSLGLWRSRARGGKPWKQEEQGLRNRLRTRILRSPLTWAPPLLPARTFPCGRPAGALRPEEETREDPRALPDARTDRGRPRAGHGR